MFPKGGTPDFTAHCTVLSSRLIILECGDVSSVASSRVWTLVGRGAALLRPGRGAQPQNIARLSRIQVAFS